MAMDVTNVVTYVAGLSVATERITETIKRIPGVSSLLSTPNPKQNIEDVRVIVAYVLAACVGMFLCYVTPADVLPSSFQGGWSYVFFGVLASGGSGFWNNAVDSLREIKKQTQDPRKAERAAAEVAKNPPTPTHG